MTCGTGALAGGEGLTPAGRFMDCFFFSVHTLATIGYGTLHPHGMAANVLVAVEALVGLCVFALETGIIFARFSRPAARIRFSKNAIIAPYHGITAFEFRVINTSSAELVEMTAKVIFTRGARTGESDRRVYEQLKLERDVLTFFPLQWTIVHPIDEESPLRGLTLEDLHVTGAEFIILLTGTEETFSQQVHTRTSYRAEEIVWGARFRDMYSLDETGVVETSLLKLDNYDVAELPGPVAGVTQPQAS
jgi:inward rectifier potassium channel